MYTGTAFGPKFRKHPLAAALVRRQMKVLDKRNAMIKAQVRRSTTHLPVARPERAVLPQGPGPRLLRHEPAVLGRGQGGFSRQAMVEALKAEGDSVGSGSYPSSTRT